MSPLVAADFDSCCLECLLPATTNNGPGSREKRPEKTHHDDVGSAGRITRPAGSAIKEHQFIILSHFPKSTIDDLNLPQGVFKGHSQTMPLILQLTPSMIIGAAQALEPQNYCNAGSSAASRYSPEKQVFFSQELTNLPQEIQEKEKHLRGSWCMSSRTVSMLGRPCAGGVAHGHLKHTRHSGSISLLTLPEATPSTTLSYRSVASVAVGYSPLAPSLSYNIHKVSLIFLFQPVPLNSSSHLRHESCKKMTLGLRSTMLFPAHRRSSPTGFGFEHGDWTACFIIALRPRTCRIFAYGAACLHSRMFLHARRCNQERGPRIRTFAPAAPKTTQLHRCTGRHSTTAQQRECMTP